MPPTIEQLRAERDRVRREKELAKKVKKTSVRAVKKAKPDDSAQAKPVESADMHSVDVVDPAMRPELGGMTVRVKTCEEAAALPRFYMAERNGHMVKQAYGYRVIVDGRPDIALVI